MSRTRDDRDDSKLIEVLKAGRLEEPELTPSRLELERRRLMARLSASEVTEPSRRWRPLLVGGFAGVAAVAAAAALVLVFVSGDYEQSNSEVTLAGVWNLEEGDAIARGTPVRIPDDGHAKMILEDGTEIWAGPGTRMVLEDASGAGIRLGSGHVVADVKPRAAGNRFKIITEDATVRVLGTLFSVRVKDERTTVRLHRGKVRLDCQDRVVAMDPGHQVVAGEDGLISMGNFDPEDVGKDLDLAGFGSVLDDGAAVVVVDDEVAPPRLVEGPDSTIEDDDEEVGRPDGELVEEDLGGSARKVEKARSRGTPSESVTGSVERLWKSRRYDEIVRLTQETGLDAPVLHYRGKALAKLKRWYEAGETFGAVAGMSPALRPEALYLAARSYNRARAFDRSLDMAQLAISMGGPNADHAWRIKFGSLSGQGLYHQAATSATEYLKEFPSGAHVGEAHFVRATGFRVARRWAEAHGAYADYLARGKGTALMGDDAAFYLGYCKIKADRPTEGRRQLEKYLEQYPKGRHAQQVRATLAH